MTTATPLTFQPQRSQSFLDDPGTGTVVLHFGQVICPDCGRSVDVSAEQGSPASGYCPGGCPTPLVVACDDSHLRLDDSRPPIGYGCLCGDPLCRAWEAVG
jgi:hypothetical protein